MIEAYLFNSAIIAIIGGIGIFIFKYADKFVFDKHNNRNENQ